MTLYPDRERVRQVLADTVGLLCKNGLGFQTELSVEALIGITIDRKEVFLVNIKETYGVETTSSQTADDCKLPVSQRLQDPSASSKDTTYNSEINSAVHHRRQFSTSSSQETHHHVNQVENNSAFVDRIKVGYTNSLKHSYRRRSLKRNTACRSTLLTDDRVKKARHSEESLKPVLDARIKTEVVEAPGAPAYARSPESIEPRQSPLRSEESAVESNVASSSRKDGNLQAPLTGPTDGFSRSKHGVSQVLSDDHRGSVPNAQAQSNPKTCSDLHGVDSVRTTRCSPQVLCDADRAGHALQSNSQGLPVESYKDTPKRPEARADEHRSRGSALYEVPQNSSSSSCEVVCIKEEVPSPPCLNPGASDDVDPDRFVLRNERIHRSDSQLMMFPLDGFNLESLSYDGSAAWKDSEASLLYSGRRQRKDWMPSSWNHESSAPPNFEDSFSFEKQTTQAIQAILLYDGQYVPLRDIQRLRLCGMAAGQIRMVMERLSSYGGKLGSFQVLHGGVNLFYKCPPDLADRDMLESYCIPWETYRFHYEVVPTSNVTTKHSEQYWQKVASSSPYIPSHHQVLPE